MYNGRPITNGAVMMSNHFLERGVRQFPDDWELPFMLGCNYLFELKTEDPKAARRVPAHRRRVGAPRRHRRWRAVVGAASGRDDHAAGGAGGGGGAPPRGGLRLDAGRAHAQRSAQPAHVAARQDRSRARGARARRLREGVEGDPALRAGGSVRGHRTRRGPAAWTWRRSARSAAAQRRSARRGDAGEDGAPLGRVVGGERALAAAMASS